MMHTGNQETAVKKLIPLLAAAVPSAISILLFAQLQVQYGQSFTDFVRANRTATQIVVQILSHALGLLQIYSVRACQQFNTRLRLFRASTRLEKVGFWLAISSGQINLSPSATHVSLCILALAVCIVPGALWAGALTPLIIHPKSGDMHISIPRYSQDSSGFWDGIFEMRGHLLWNHVKNCRGSGLVTTCPVPVLQGLLLSSAGSATTSDGSVRKHSKLDSAAWSYSGRSYGVGASIGLASAMSELGTADSLEYTDYGYVANVDCIYNTSSNYTLSIIGEDVGPTYINVYQATGFLPNSYDLGTGEGTGESYPVVSTWGDCSSILAWSARAIAGKNYIVLTSGQSGNYTQFNHTQCRVTFESSAFTVQANLTAKSIIVQPAALASASAHLVPNETVTVNAINSLNLLSRMSGSLYTSVLGDALSRNLATSTTSATTVSSAVVLSSLQDSFTAVLDDILAAYGASQIVLANDTTTVPLTLVVPKTKIGEKIYTTCSLALSISLMLFHVIEIARTRFWARLLVFDVFDAKSVIVAASAGGSGIADRLRARRKGDERMREGYVVATGESNGWIGRPDDRALAGLDVRFCIAEQHNIPAVVAAEAAEDGEDVWVDGGRGWFGKRRIGMRTVEVSSGGSYLLNDRQDLL